MAKDELWYVILNMNCKYEICRMCPKSGLFKGSYEECEKWIEQKKKEEMKDELKNKISMALRDPILQQGFEVICKKNAELEQKIDKMKCLNEEIIKALNECLDYEWLHAHNGKAKYLYLQTVIDIVNEKFKENEKCSM